ncbi:GNAT family protein [Streptomyces sp. ICBB 8177]|uniref:GNAT family N-acetyltransferase n=1 Tax=Streptomyces sp. ICBB 8177 TaxID=563922 RepID=UPI000D6796FB|nr:GNAT family protein [Streptomyces sp. ICBB 8177]PWI41516.1 GNAT family N-acetyltransferase [Streptomyces sp. ICBB 8177]
MPEPPFDVPRLPAGDSLALRPWTLADLPLVEEASGDPYIPLITTVPSAYSHAAGVAFVERQWDRAAHGTGWPFVVERVADGRAVGTVGLWSAPHARASAGYWVAPSARGGGAALAGLRAATAWAFAALGLARVELYVEPWNTASRRTAESAGFRPEGLLRSWQEVGGARRDMLMYARLPTDPVG